jgi:DnaK suppressor protein
MFRLWVRAEQAGGARQAWVTAPVRWTGYLARGPPRYAAPTMSNIEDIRRNLVARRESLLRRVMRAEDDIRWLDSNVSSELEEEAQEGNLSRLLGELDERGRAEIEAIDDALLRIERGDYGRCEECDEEIPVARLEVMPRTTLCVTCAEAREHQAAQTNPGVAGRA